MKDPTQWQQALAAPFDIEDIQQRPLVTKKDKSAAIPANYVDARAVMNRLDSVVGSFNWQVQYQEVKGVLYAGLGIRHPETNDWIFKYGAGTESTHEKQKGEASDAFKRAAVKFGIGRHLYNIPDRWINGYRDRSGKFRFDQNALEQYRVWLAKFIGQEYNPVMPASPSTSGNGRAKSNGTVQEPASVPTEMQLAEAETLVEHPLFAHDRRDWVRRSTEATTEHAFEAFLRELRKEKQMRRARKEQFRRQLNRAKQSFESIGESGKFTYQLRRTFETSSLDKIVAQHWNNGEEILQSLRAVYSELSQQRQAA